MAVADVSFTFDEAIRVLGITPARLEKLIEEGRIPVTQPDGVHVRIPRQAILEYLAEVSAVPLKQREGRAK